MTCQSHGRIISVLKLHRMLSLSLSLSLSRTYSTTFSALSLNYSRPLYWSFLMAWLSATKFRSQLL